MNNEIHIYVTSLSSLIELLLRQSIPIRRDCVQGSVPYSPLASQFTLSLSKGRTLVRSALYSPPDSYRDTIHHSPLPINHTPL